jgi:hypothetical protein
MNRRWLAVGALAVTGCGGAGTGGAVRDAGSDRVTDASAHPKVDSGSDASPFDASRSDSGSGADSASTMDAGADSTSSPPDASSNALDCPNGYCALGNGGQTFAYSDSDPPGTGTSTASLVPGSKVCVTGTAAQVPDANAFPVYWGAGVGINLDQSQAPGSTPAVFVPTSTGVSYALDNLPPNARILIGDATLAGDYCYNLTSASGIIPWTSFAKECWAGGANTPLAGPPTDATSIRFQVYTDTNAAHPFDFCVTNLSFSYSAATVPWQTRTDYGQVLEPVGDHILSNVGQDIQPAFYDDFVRAVGKAPAVYMTYQTVGSSPSALASWEQSLATTLKQISSDEILVQIGYDFCSTWCTGTNPVDAQVAAGAYDTNVQGLCSALQALNRPAYIRLGYEFNGAWNGYQAATYVTAFQHVASMLKSCGPRVAFVWDYSMDDTTGYAPFYPGDAYVDWWGLNFFNTSNFTNSSGLQFMQDSRTHGKPVMIGESTPETLGAQDGATDWNAWFVPFFNYIYSQPNMKMYTYINIDWTQTTQWPTWGNAIIPGGSVIASDFGAELANPQYLLRMPGTTIQTLLH